MRQLMILILLMATAIEGLSQEFTIHGEVLDSHSGQGLPGSSIAVDSTLGTITNSNGSFRLSLPAGTYQLLFSYTGYQSKIISAAGAENDSLYLTILLEPKSELLDQVVVSSSRFEQKLSEVTVSFELIKPEEISSYNFVKLDEAVERKPGVDVIDGQANIRGGSGYSYGAGSRALLLVDGMPMVISQRIFQWLI